MTEVVGIVSRLIYSNDGWTVAIFTEDATNASHTVVGYMNVVAGEHLKITGKSTNNPTYGDQIKVDSYTRYVPTTEEGVIALLGSGLLKGIGSQRAQWMVDHFGVRVLDMIKNQDKALQEVPGIGKKLSAQICTQYHQFYGKERLVGTLVNAGFTRGMVQRIISHFNDSSLEVIEKNPYKLMKLPGVGFRRADVFAKLLGIEDTHPSRVQESLIYILSEQSEGNTYLPKDLLYDKFDELIQFKDANLNKTILFEDALKALSIIHRVVSDDKGVHLAKYAMAEEAIAKDLIQRSLDTTTSIPSDEIIPILDKWQSSEGFTLTDDQRTAIIRSVMDNVTVITGSPGTGKTSTISAIIHVFDELEMSVALAAPTGRAAKRMQETSNMEASTIHRLLGFGTGGDFKFQYDKDNKYNTDVIIVDEVSMIDVMLMNSLLNAIKSNTKLILVGDKDQLQSVSAGNVLDDVIKSGKVNTVELRQIFRQGKGSLLVTNAQIINAGHSKQNSHPLTGGKSWGTEDFYITKKVSKQTVLSLVQKHIPNNYGISMDDTLILTPMRKKYGDLNCTVLNEEIQSLVNPFGQKLGIPFIDLRVGDKVMQTRNDYSKDVFNGDVGYVVSADPPRKGHQGSLKVEFYGIEVNFEYMEAKSLVHAWCSTIHKAQGSQAEAVVVVLPDNYISRRMLTRNLLYTGITRAKKVCVLVSTDLDIIKAIKTSGTSIRYTDLTDKMEAWYYRLIR